MRKRASARGLWNTEPDDEVRGRIVWTKSLVAAMKNDLTSLQCATFKDGDASLGLSFDTWMRRGEKMEWLATTAFLNAGSLTRTESASPTPAGLRLSGGFGLGGGRCERVLTVSVRKASANDALVPEAAIFENGRLLAGVDRLGVLRCDLVTSSGDGHDEG